MEAKIIEVYPHYDLDDGSYTSIGSDITNWEEITEEELNLLKEFLHVLNYQKNAQHAILINRDNSVKRALLSIKDVVDRAKQEKLKKEQRIAAQEAKREETRVKRELRQLEKLEEKYRKSGLNEA
jgi:hypothetical protein